MPRARKTAEPTPAAAADAPELALPDEPYALLEHADPGVYRLIVAGESFDVLPGGLFAVPDRHLAEALRGADGWAVSTRTLDDVHAAIAAEQGEDQQGDGQGEPGVVITGPDGQPLEGEALRDAVAKADAQLAGATPPPAGVKA